ncbi:efflux RND transporter periplasmic adaptor subunit [Kordiimonas aestuarii]|uniref:efflux RND transporter periplasmic adaptor subunit n=1 Tax=Kordiimonas aestuarii TaxID=1005925 RepID=UPI0021D3D633|nr:efflux RND transporter periplasmic adaptor subunit [Kordiimonas aestuarii]
MKRVIEAFHVKRKSERTAGFLQILLVILVIGGTIGITRLIRHNAASGPGISGILENVVVDTVTPKRTNHTLARTLTGEVEARASVSIAPQVSGRITELSPNMAPGKVVRAGETLFRIDPTDYELALKQAEAQVASAEAELLQTEATADNYIKDWRRVFPNEPTPALVAKEPQVKALQAKLLSATAMVEQAKLNLARTAYSLSYDARITESRIERGQQVSAAGQYGSLYALDGLRIRASITPHELSLLGLNQGTQVTIVPDRATDGGMPATITSIGGDLSGTTRLQNIFIELPRDTALVPGTFATIKATKAVDGDVFELPASALATTNTVWTVANGKLKRVTVDIVDIKAGQLFTRPFDAGEGVVTTEVPTSFINRPVKVRRRAGDAS